MNKTELVLKIDGVFEKDSPIEINETGLKEDLALLAITYLAELTTSEETSVEAAEQTAIYMKMLQNLSGVLNANIERDKDKEIEAVEDFLKELFDTLECNCENCREEENNVSED